MVAELGSFFGRKVLLLIRLKVFLHLLHNMLGLVKVLNIQVCRGPGNLLRMTALRTEFPLLETVHVRERTARGAPDDKVHTNEVIGVIVINKYRRFAEKTGFPCSHSSPSLLFDCTGCSAERSGDRLKMRQNFPVTPLINPVFFLQSRT